MSDPVEDARQAAWRGAMAVSQNRRNLAASMTITAELSVMRGLLARGLPGGEAEYWTMVETELRK